LFNLLPILSRLDQASSALGINFVKVFNTDNLKIIDRENSF